MNSLKEFEQFIRNEEDTNGFLDQRLHGEILDSYIKRSIDWKRDTELPHESLIVIIEDAYVLGHAKVVPLKTAHKIEHYYKFRSIPCPSLMVHVLVQYPNVKHVILPNGIFAVKSNTIGSDTTNEQSGNVEDLLDTINVLSQRNEHTVPFDEVRSKIKMRLKSENDEGAECLQQMSWSFFKRADIPSGHSFSDYILILKESYDNAGKEIVL